MFGHPAQHGHMVSGLKNAIASPKTPAHLKPHLQKQLGRHMRNTPNAPVTAAKPQNKQGTVQATGNGAAAQSMIKQPPTPFRNPNLKLSTPTKKVVPAKKGKKSAFYGE